MGVYGKSNRTILVLARFNQEDVPQFWEFVPCSGILERMTFSELPHKDAPERLSLRIFRKSEKLEFFTENVYTQDLGSKTPFRFCANFEVY